MNARNWRKVADDSVVGRSDDNGLAVRDVKLREAEGAMEWHRLVRVGTRRARREQRAIFAGGTSGREELQARRWRAIRIIELKGAK